jgi:phosphoglycolate phosphatase
MNKYQSVLFDLDGTLTDSGQGIMKSAQYAFEKMSMKVPPFEDLRVFVGPPLSDEFAAFGVKENDIDKAIAFYRERYVTKGKYENVPYEGICELLKRLQKDGYRLFVATSKPEGLANEILHRFHMDQYFEMIAGATVDRTRETKQDVLEYLLQSTDISSAVMIGDTRFDVEGAAACGIPCIGVSWGYGKDSEIIDAGAVTLVHTMNELQEAIKKQTAQ